MSLLKIRIHNQHNRGISILGPLIYLMPPFHINSLLAYLRWHLSRSPQPAPPITDRGDTMLKATFSVLFTKVWPWLSFSCSVPRRVNSDKGFPLHWRSGGSLSSEPSSYRNQGADRAAAWRWPAAPGQTGSRRTPAPLPSRLPPGSDLEGEAGRGDPHWEVGKMKSTWCSEVSV